MPSATPPLKPDSQPIPALLIWLATNLVALCIGAARVPLWARFPTHTEQYAIDEMIVMQLAAASLLCQVLLCDLRTTLLIAASSLPFIGLSGLLAGTRTTDVAIAGAQVTRSEERRVGKEGRSVW